VLPIRVGADRIVDLRDDLLHPEDLLRDLRGHEIPVVALRQRDERIGLLDTGLAEDVEIGAVAEQRRSLEVLRQMREGGAFEIDHSDVVAAGVEQASEERSGPAAADDDDLHPISS